MRIILFLSNSSYGLPFTSLFYSQSLIFQSTSCKTNTYIHKGQDRSWNPSTNWFEHRAIRYPSLIFTFSYIILSWSIVWQREHMTPYLCSSILPAIVMCTVSQFTKSLKNRFCKMSATNFVNRMPIETKIFDYLPLLFSSTSRSSLKIVSTFISFQFTISPLREESSIPSCFFPSCWATLGDGRCQPYSFYLLQYSTSKL